MGVARPCFICPVRHSLAREVVCDAPLQSTAICPCRWSSTRTSPSSKRPVGKTSPRKTSKTPAAGAAVSSAPAKAPAKKAPAKKTATKKPQLSAVEEPTPKTPSKRAEKKAPVEPVEPVEQTIPVAVDKEPDVIVEDLEDVEISVEELVSEIDLTAD